MDVKQLMAVLKDFDEESVVTCGDLGSWSNIEYVVQDGSCIKIIMSSNAVFSDDCASEKEVADNSASTNIQSTKATHSCPVCGCPCTIGGDDSEGTHYYVPHP